MRSQETPRHEEILWNIFRNYILIKSLFSFELRDMSEEMWGGCVRDETNFNNTVQMYRWKVMRMIFESQENKS